MMPALRLKPQLAGAMRMVSQNFLSFSTGTGGLTRVRLGSVSHSLWQRINRPVYHPVSKHFQRQLKGGLAGPPVVALSLLAALFLFLALARLYGSIGAHLIWLMPLGLLLHSLVCSLPWLFRIVLLISRQGRAGVLDQVSVIPPGGLFIYFAICKTVLHRDDALAWTMLLRKLAAGIVFFAVAMLILVTLGAVERVNTGRLALLLVELSLLCFAIAHEHKQSVVLLCLLPMALSRRLKSQIDGASLTLACYITLQLLSFMLAVAGPLALQTIARHAHLSFDISAQGLALMLALFLLVRELLIGLLWRVARHQSNAVYTHKGV